MTRIPVLSAAGGASGLDDVVHVPVHADSGHALEHRVFVVCYLATGIAALAALPIYLAFASEVTGPGAIVTAMLALPLVISLYAMRTGALDRSHTISVVSASVMLSGLAAVSGGLLSPVVPSLALVLGLAHAMGSARTRNAVIAISIGALIAVVTGHFSGLVIPASIDAALPLPVWLVGALIAFPSILHAIVWIQATRVAASFNAEEMRGEIRRNRRMIDNAADLVTLHNRAGNLVHASDASNRLLGAAPSMLIDAGLFNRVHVGDRPAYLRLIDAAQSGNDMDAADIRIRTGDVNEGPPQYGWFEMRCRAIPASHDVVVVLRETGQRKAHEEERDAAIAEAQRANSMKTRFLASVSHELRTPLNAIIGFSEVLEQELFGAFEYDKHREYAGLIHQSGRHLLDVVNDILDMSKIEAGKFEIVAEPFDIEPVLKSCAAMLQGRADERGVRLEMVIEPHLPEVCADRRALKQICINLLSNAVKFTREDTAEGKSGVMLSATRRGGNVCIVVKDNGIGIAPEDLAHVGEPFYQVHGNYARRYEGTGLGLSVVKGLVHLHGGRMDIDSTLGLGTTVTIVLPIDGNDGKAEPQAVEDVVKPLHRHKGMVSDPRATVESDMTIVAPFVRKAG
ncbi:MAG: HAMP domain-containing histidine kinase [Rhodobiaceae bacterium]|nr:HAMP domain-containing histidine kinase [Rhodobiaceae bacterium]MCC0012922.1 HAMP domain-containing histidine kinase [Rhodobiaceae bacterium]MCC0018957.1 HAMP domain-containing histidine kinase [Rhodobiaceae bacterium]MCC0060051.1 HAMP domain-containing histidine kinase [Rhodobiaceae bacterium]